MSDQKIVNVLFKKLYCDSQLPSQAHPGDAGLDLYCHDLEKWLYPYNKVVIDCGFAMALPPGWEAQILDCSEMLEKNITIFGSAIIERNKYNKIICRLQNNSHKTIKIRRNDKIARMYILEVPFIDTEEVEEL
jgi:dUTP pyrophosphatase